MTAEFPLNPPQLLRNALPAIADQLLLRLPELLLYAVKAKLNYDLPYMIQTGQHRVHLHFQTECHPDCPAVVAASTAPTPVPELRFLTAFYRLSYDPIDITGIHFLMRGELRCSALNDCSEVYRTSLLPHELPAALADALDAVI